MKISNVGLMMIFSLYAAQFVLGISGDWPMSISFFAMFNSIILLLALFMDPVNEKDAEVLEGEA